MLQNILKLAAIGACFSFAAFSTNVCSAQQLESVPDAAANEINEQINRLVEQLGSDDFETREDAKFEIEKMGEKAFDALFAAQNHDDLEIRFAAKNLLEQITPKWIADGDPKVVKSLMHQYGQKQVAHRLATLGNIETQPINVSVVLLCRIARYDSDEVVSKAAACGILRRDIEEGSEGELLKLIGASNRSGQRIATQWIAIYSDLLKNKPNALPAMEQLVASELKSFRAYPDNPKIDQNIVGELLLWRTRMLLRADKTELAWKSVRDSIEFVKGSHQKITRLADWMYSNKTWKMLIELTNQYPRTFENSPILTYFAASAHKETGDQEKMQFYVDKALNRESQTISHQTIAVSLQSRGMIEWAENEYRKHIEKSDLIDMDAIRSRSILADMIFDRGDAMAAADVLRPLAKAIQGGDKNPSQQAQISKIFNNYLKRDPQEFVGRMNYYESEYAKKQGDKETVVANLKKALSADPNDADSLISLYEISKNRAELQPDAKRRIKITTGKFLDNIRRYQNEVQEANNQQRFGDEQRSKMNLALSYNQYAWLVCNTFGDFKQAIEYSKKSLEIRPDSSSYFDTLAHCYYATKDYENAVKSQRKAVKFEPTSRILQQKLKLFEDALAKSKKDPEK